MHEEDLRNAGIIKTLPRDVAEDVTKYVVRESVKGRRADNIMDDVQQMGSPPHVRDSPI